MDGKRETEGEVPAPEHRFGFVAIVGRANVGKSTLLNRLVGSKVAIVSPVAQTTRHRILGVRNMAGGQIAFLDSPGDHKPQHQLGAVMMEKARAVAQEADLVLVVVDASEGIGPGDRHVLGEIGPAESKTPVIMVVNKVDSTNKAKALPIMEAAIVDWGCKEAVPVSAETGDNCDRLLDVILGYLPPGPAHFPPDFLTDQDERRIIEESVREKLLAVLRQEVPHAVAVHVDDVGEREDGLVEIIATIHVERPSQKGIVIGARGARLKQVGTLARKELEHRFERKVFLKLWVKVSEDWRDRPQMLRDFGVYQG